MKPRLLILTGSKIHHKYFINKLSECGEIIGVIIEDKKAPSKRKKMKHFGYLWTMAKFLSKLNYRFQKSDEYATLLNKQEIEKRFEDFQDRIIKVSNINSEESIKIIEDLAPDYICSLGGGLIEDKGISLAKKCALNFHSGISPFYNGADINSKVFENRNLNYLGGTLMIMTAKIDGGMILSHYFPSIELQDTPNTLFYKGIIGGTELYKEFINYNEKEGRYTSIHQKKPMHYYLGYDHTIMTDIVVKYFLRKGLIKKFIRPDKKINYYDNSSTVKDLLSVLNLF